MKSELCIEGVRIADDSRCFLVAEIGHNHQGSLESCMSHFYAAKQSGATAVKLQKRNNKTLFTKSYYNQPYLSEHAYGSTYGLHREALEFEINEMRVLQQYAKELGIIFFATAFDCISADVLQHLDMPAFKIASGDIRNLPLIRHIALFQKPIFLSTGGANLDHVREAVEVVLQEHSQLAILQCTAAYPPRDDEINLSVLKTYSTEFQDQIIGYSSHDLGTTACLAAYALGARVIEKHFTLDRSLPGSDHKISLLPNEFSSLSKELNRLWLALGNSEKKIIESERPAIEKMGKKLVASKNLSAGHVVGELDVCIKSPGDGLPPSMMISLIGKKLMRPLVEDESFALHHFE